MGVIISQITARLTNLFGRKRGVKSPTLHEAAKSNELNGWEKTNDASPPFLRYPLWYRV
jgi:hypothetical protein